MTLILNLFGGPGVGKSTTCAGVFHELKLASVNCEMVLEFAKGKVWEGSDNVLANQIYIFGKQFHQVWRLLDKVDVIITDSPLLNSILYYKGENTHFAEMVLEEHKKLHNLNALLERLKPYNPSGRLQDEKKARRLDIEIQEILDSSKEPYREFPGNKHAVTSIVAWVLQEIVKLD